MASNWQRAVYLLASISVLVGCATAPSAEVITPWTPPSAWLGKTDVAAALSGEFDNHEQVWHSESAGNRGAIARSRYRIVRLSGEGERALLRVERESASRGAAQRSGWQLRLWRDETSGATRLAVLLPSGKGGGAQAMSGCELAGDWKEGAFVASGNKPSCLAALSESGAKQPVPVALSSDGDILRMELLDPSLPNQAIIESARRLRHFTGWVALNRAGPGARSGNDDWQVERGLSLHSEGSRWLLRHRDGSDSGYLLELARLTYAESATPMLRLALVQGKTGQIITYVYANPDAHRIGMNLGWLQCGFEALGSAAAASAAPPATLTTR